jgi:hypothetical protein
MGSWRSGFVEGELLDTYRVPPVNVRSPTRYLQWYNSEALAATARASFLG